MRNKYWVVWNSTIDNWQVKKTGNDAASKNFKQKDPAVRYATVLAKKNKPSQLFIKNKDGKIVDERTYEKDPYPPKG